ncbi:MAG: citramalate synthase [Oscillospiraceae bacterium]|nr:citramalate synthase [Oscillospiraceae bacterium]
MKHKNQKIYIYDSTLRDGCQAEGISFTVEDKLNIVRVLDGFGIDYIEAGNPGSNPKDLEFFKRVKELKLKHTKIVAFGSTRKRNKKLGEDKNILALLNAGTEDVCIVGKSWDLHVKQVIAASLDENLQMITDTIEFFVSKNKRVHFDAEHFFDGYKKNPEYAMDTIAAAQSAGAISINLCDTNGGSFPSEIRETVRTVISRLDIPVGIHCHNDMECAAANSIIAVDEGAKIVQGTFAGFGERCGNACLSSLIPSFQLKLGYDCIPSENMSELTSITRYIAECANIVLPGGMAYVGKNAFAHKGGMHADGVNKIPESFEHISPDIVGNKRNILISELAGRASILGKINSIAPDVTKNSPETEKLIEILKESERCGYQYEAATASLELIVLKTLGMFKPRFELDDFHVLGLKQAGTRESAEHQNIKIQEDQRQAEQRKITENKSVATVKVKVGGETFITADEGEGPVHALDKAFRRAVTKFFPEIKNVRLVDYKVRILDTSKGTGTKVRVLIETTDGEDVWTTVGVSTDIINASLNALIDSIEYKLLQEPLHRNKLDFEKLIT